MHSIDKLLIVIVLYNRQLSSTEAFKSILDSAILSNISIDVLVYDNSLNSQFLNTYKHVHLFYHSDPSNGGVSRAYNFAVKKALEKRKTWILLSDQDTVFPINMLQVYLNAIESDKSKIYVPLLKEKSGKIISPVIFKFHRGFSPKFLSAGPLSLTKYLPVNSGVCIEINTVLNVGGYDERIQLDYSDFDFFNRIKYFLKYFYLLPIECYHSLSIINDTDLNSTLKRFKHLCNGIKLSSRNNIERFYATVVITMRSLKLTCKHRNPIFLKLLISEYFIRFFRKANR